jgi:ABC-2 type transport system permease protein
MRLDVAMAILRRNVLHMRNPAIILPSTLFPLVFLVAFAGGLSNVENVPGFDFPSGYTSFQFVFVLLQAAAFGGVFTGFAIAADFELGFARRLLLASPHRFGLIIGYVLAAFVRFAATAALITAAALIAGMRVDGGVVDVFGLYGLALLVSAASALFGAGVAMRTKSLSAGPAMQTPVFLILFLAPVYVPLHLLEGWINAVASVNPVTAIVESARGFIAGEPDKVGLAILAGGGLTAAMLVYATAGLRRAERGE